MSTAQSAPGISELGISKVLVANRGEIAIRAFRAAHELGIRTVAVHTFEDQRSLHRLKADEAYEIGEPGKPVRAYLDPDAIVAAALRSGADAVYPGYGFLSESPDLAVACRDAGLTFVGPSAEILELAGNKMAARGAAERAGLPVLAQSGALPDPREPGAAAEIAGWADQIGFPLFVKAAAGGGGRGLRRIEDAAELTDAIAQARSEAASAFGDDTVFLEEALSDVRHIEVQVLADATGSVLHLHERDCSVQRRFQKVVEIAPAPGLDPDVRDALCAEAVRFAQSIDYRNAGTVEFLVGSGGRHVFMEMNPRIQVEHTVTEEVTDVDLVQAQLRIAGGASFDDLGLRQDEIVVRGVALQCRVTAEDPRNDFRPDTGRITTFRQPGGAGVRLDGGGGYVGAEITPYFDSLIVKVTCRGRTFEAARRRAERALAEFRVRGVGTNLAFLRAVLADPDFAAGGVSTDFIEQRPHLTAASVGADRATRLLLHLADVTVNRPYGPSPVSADPVEKLPPRPERFEPGSRDRLAALGPEQFAAELRADKALAVTDTTLRDAHQSILATRVRTIDLVIGARHLAHGQPSTFSLECWGGATFDVALRFLHEDPWTRLARLRESVPNVCLQMLLRGRNTVGYSPYPDVVCERFVAEAHRLGIDIFRIFDAFNDIEQMRPAIAAARDVGAVAQGALCYSGDLADPGEDLYTLDYYLRVAESLVDAGVHMLCIKDMAGLLRAPAAAILVKALRERFDLPVHLHTHDTAGGQLATYLAAIEAGVDVVDAAAPPLSGMTSQPSMSAVIAATDHTDRSTGLSMAAVNEMEPYWEAVRSVYAPFEAGLRAPTGTVYRHEIPGGQLSNLRQQAVALGLGDRFELVEELYAGCNELLGRPIKVTPSSKVVGDLALHLAASGVTVAQLAAEPATVDLPDSVIGFLHGELGTPPGGFPEPFRRDALAGRPAHSGLVSLAEADRVVLDGGDATDGDVQEGPGICHGGGPVELPGVSVRAKLSSLLLPGPAAGYREQCERFGDLSVLPSRLFWYGLDVDEDDVMVGLEQGVRLLVGLEAIGEPNDDGMRSVVFRLNGQLRPVDIRDKAAATSTAVVEKASPSDPSHVAAPFRGLVSLAIEVGQVVEAGDAVATIEAMKMESQISAPHSGTVERLAVAPSSQVEPGDLLAVIRPAGTAGAIDVDPDN